MSPPDRAGGAFDRLSPRAFRQLLKSKGWSISNLAWRWGVSVEHLAREIANPERTPRWDDAARGVEPIDAECAARIKRERLEQRPRKLTQQAPRPARQGLGYRYHGELEIGSVLVVFGGLGEIPEGARAVVRAIEDDGSAERYLVEFDDGYGAFWFGPDDIDAAFVATGEVE